ncbi:hypothetical protein GLOIN_2v1732300, partial [Rhizophagus irregularis DAOM 181602=DAOM 197198]
MKSCANCSNRLAITVMLLLFCCISNVLDVFAGDFPLLILVSIGSLSINVIPLFIYLYYVKL